MQIKSEELSFKGLERLNINDINSLTSINILEKSDFSDVEINTIIQEFYNSDQFIEITSIIENGQYIISLQESPTIENIYINGNVFINDDIFFNFLNSKPNYLLSKKNINQDLDLIKNIYSQKGFIFANVNVSTEKYSKNRVNLIFDINEGETSSISQINFIGNKTFSSNLLNSIIKSKEDNYFNFLSPKTSFNNSFFDNDLQLLKDFYKKKGFQDIDITYIVNKSTFNTFYLTFYVEENSRYKVNEIDFKISDLVSNLDGFYDIKNNLERDLLSNDSFYDYDLFDQFLIDLNFLLSKSNLNSEISYDISLSDTNYNIKIYDQQKLPIIVNSIEVQGNSITKSHVLLSKIDISPGDYYLTSKARKSKERLTSLKYINDTTLTAEPNDNKVDIIFDVQENKKTGSLLLGGSFNADVGLGLSFSIKDSNFIGSGNELQSDISLNSEVALFNIAYKQYPYLNPNISNSYNFQNEENDLSSSFGFKVDQKGLGYTLNFKYDEDIVLSSGIEYVNQKGHSGANNSDLSITDNIGTFDDIIIKLRASIDKTNNSLYPNDGYSNSFSLKLAPENISDNNFFSITYSGDVYYKLENSVNYLFVSNRLGLTDSFNGRNKTINAFSLGGNNFKGFDYRGIGKRSSGNKYIGGNKYFTSTLGYGSSFLFDEKDNIYFKLFYSFGSLWDSDYIDQDFAVRSSTGISMDVLTPIGPLSLTYAIPLESTSDDIKRNFTFSIGTAF